MFFPYDITQANIYMANFGALSISTAQIVSEHDTMFVVGRSTAFLEHLSTLQDFKLVREPNTDYIPFLQTFDKIYFIAPSQDF